MDDLHNKLLEYEKLKAVLNELISMKNKRNNGALIAEGIRKNDIGVLFDVSGSSDISKEDIKILETYLITGLEEIFSERNFKDMKTILVIYYRSRANLDRLFDVVKRSLDNLLASLSDVDVHIKISILYEYLQVFESIKNSNVCVCDIIGSDIGSGDISTHTCFIEGKNLSENNEDKASSFLSKNDCTTQSKPEMTQNRFDDIIEHLRDVVILHINLFCQLEHEEPVKMDKYLNEMILIIPIAKNVGEENTVQDRYRSYEIHYLCSCLSILKNYESNSRLEDLYFLITKIKKRNSKVNIDLSKKIRDVVIEGDIFSNNEEIGFFDKTFFSNTL